MVPLLPFVLPTALFFSNTAIKTNCRGRTSLKSNMELLDNRLCNVGAKNYQFVKLDDGSAVEGMFSAIEAEANAANSNRNNNVEQIKTLIWEAVLLVPPCPSGPGKMMEEIIDHYFVTALRVEDRVDLTKLYALVKHHTPSIMESETSQKRLILRLANREMAESLSGFKSGTIPPICHTTAMPLYLDDVISMNENIVASLGSGAEGYDVYIPVQDILQIAELTLPAVYVRSLSQQKKSLTALDMPEQLSVTSRDVTKSAEKVGVQQLASTKGREARAKLLRSTAKKKGNAQVLRQMLDEVGNEFPHLMEVQDYGTGGIDKNALHIACWKGDLESMKLLIERGKKFGLDLVNTISVGDGNYGKTPIFYSLTQCREDAVMLLVENKADLLIVNNKGQTPCSIAVSHLKPEICQLLYDMEANQLQSGGVFKNYRATNSDGKRYGDLDPRFEIDEANMGEDLIPQLETFHQMINDATGVAINSVESSSEDIHSILQSTVIPGLPRSIRPTVRHWQLTPSERDENAKLMKARKVRNQMASARRKSKKMEKQETLAEDDIDFDSLEVLSFNNTSVFGSDHRAIVVEDEAGIAALCDAIAASVASSEAVGSVEVSDLELLDNSWGLDAEWQPSYTRGYETPVATLQLHHAGSNTSFLVDVQALFQSGVADANKEMTDLEKQLSGNLAKIFSSPQIPILGFGVAMDLGKLAASFPHIPCFRRFESVIDLHTVSRNVYAGSPKSYLSSLKKMTAVLLGLNMDKAQQCSDWEQRPLTEPQVNYALLDSAVLPVLLKKMICDAKQFDGKFFHSHQHLRTTTKLMCLGGISDEFSCPPQLAFRVPNGSCKIHLQHIMARQMWTTGKDDPAPPVKLSVEAQQSVALTRLRSNRQPKQENDNDNDNNRREKKTKKKTIKLNNISIDLSNIPTPGSVIDYTKDVIINHLVGEELLESIKQQQKRLSYNKRGGVLVLENAFCLFINFGLSKGGALPTNWHYRNEVLDGGRVMTFTVNIDRDDERKLSDFFSIHQQSNEAKKVLLFSRPGANAKFVYCGQCACSKQVETSEGCITLHLKLMDFEQLQTTQGTELSFANP